MKTKKSAVLVIVCVLLAAVLALSVFALVSAKNQIAALEEENHALKAQIENMSVSNVWTPEEAYCTLVVAEWSVNNNVLTAKAFAEAVLPGSTASAATVQNVLPAAMVPASVVTNPIPAAVRHSVPTGITRSPALLLSI